MKKTDLCLSKMIGKGPLIFCFISSKDTGNFFSKGLSDNAHLQHHHQGVKNRDEYGWQHVGNLYSSLFLTPW